MGADALDPASDMGQQAWESLLSNGPWSRKGEKVVKPRFFGLIRAGRCEAAQWSSRLFGYLTVCLEMDFLGSMSLAKLKVVEPKLNKSDTSSKMEGEEEMALRKAACNQMVMGPVFLLDSRNKDILLCILEAVAPLEKWYGEENEQLRSTTGTHMVAETVVGRILVCPRAGLRFLPREVPRGGQLQHSVGQGAEERRRHRTSDA